MPGQAMLPRQDSSEFEPVFECPDLDRDLDRQRSRGERPAREACDACPKQNECVSPDDCDNLPEPDSPGAPFEPSVGSSGVAPSSDPPIFGSSDAPCHPERSAVVSRVVEGPSVSSPEATEPSSRPERPQGSVVEGPASRSSVASPCHPERSAAEPEDPLPCHPERSAVVSRAVEGPSVSSPEATTLDPTSAALRTLISNRVILKDLAPKFPHLAEFARLVK